MKGGSSIAAVLMATGLTLVGCAHRPYGQGWITLLDGSNLDHWNVVGDGNWRVVDGVVQADMKTGKDNGFLVSKNTYRDFEIRAEFWVSDDANSGIYMRCADPKVITDRSCYEANIFDQRPDPTYGTGAITHLVAVSPMPKAGGKWNTLHITVKGTELTVVLNGSVTARGQDSKLASGPIALQYAAGMVKFRKVEIRPL
jgi:3-keto-disaccharide hydrolase